MSSIFSNKSTERSVVAILIAATSAIFVAAPRWDNFLTWVPTASEVEVSQPVADMSVDAVDGVNVEAVADMSVDAVDDVNVEAVDVELPTLNGPDVVRYDGNMLTLAGKATPNAELSVLDAAGNVVHQGVADANGDYAFLMDGLNVGEEGLGLNVVQSFNGSDIFADGGEITILPMDAGDATITADANGIDVDVDTLAPLNFTDLSYDADGPALLSGEGAPNANVDVALNGVPHGSTTISENGNWSYEIADLAVGAHELALNSAGVEPLVTTITRDAVEVEPVATSSKNYIVVRGDSLWRIAQNYLGDGNRYTDIYNINSTKISDPDLIYPEQEFIIPTN